MALSIANDLPICSLTYPRAHSLFELGLKIAAYVCQKVTFPQFSKKIISINNKQRGGPVFNPSSSLFFGKLQTLE